MVLPCTLYIKMHAFWQRLLKLVTLASPEEGFARKKNSYKF